MDIITRLMRGDAPDRLDDPPQAADARGDALDTLKIVPDRLFAGNVGERAEHDEERRAQQERDPEMGIDGDGAPSIPVTSLDACTAPCDALRGAADVMAVSVCAGSLASSTRRSKSVPAMCTPWLARMSSLRSSRVLMRLNSPASASSSSPVFTSIC